MSNVKVISSQIVHVGDFLTHREDLVEISSGVRFSLPVIEHPGACVIIPLHKDKLILIKQHRHAVQDYLWEFPAGKLDLNEPVDSCAQRELREETGFLAKTWSPLGVIYPAPGFSDEKQYLYFATDLEFDKQELDSDEELTVHEFEIREVEQMIISDQIKDAKSIAIFMKAKLVGLI